MLLLIWRVDWNVDVISSLALSLRNRERHHFVSLRPLVEVVCARLLVGRTPRSRFKLRRWIHGKLIEEIDYSMLLLLVRYRLLDTQHFHQIIECGR
jgi:hypothetical protein